MFFLSITFIIRQLEPVLFLRHFLVRTPIKKSDSLTAVQLLDFQFSWESHVVLYCVLYDTCTRFLREIALFIGAIKKAKDVRGVVPFFHPFRTANKVVIRGVLVNTRPKSYQSRHNSFGIVFAGKRPLFGPFRKFEPGEVAILTLKKRN